MLCLSRSFEKTNTISFNCLLWPLPVLNLLLRHHAFYFHHYGPVHVSAVRPSLRRSRLWHEWLLAPYRQCLL